MEFRADAEGASPLRSGMRSGGAGAREGPEAGGVLESRRADKIAELFADCAGGCTAHCNYGDAGCVWVPSWRRAAGVRAPAKGTGRGGRVDQNSGVVQHLSAVAIDSGRSAEDPLRILRSGASSGEHAAAV